MGMIQFEHHHLSAVWAKFKSQPGSERTLKPDLSLSTEPLTTARLLHMPEETVLASSQKYLLLPTGVVWSTTVKHVVTPACKYKCSKQLGHTALVRASPWIFFHVLKNDIRAADSTQHPAQVKLGRLDVISVTADCDNHTGIYCRKWTQRHV